MWFVFVFNLSPLLDEFRVNEIERAKGAQTAEVMHDRANTADEKTSTLFYAHS